MNRVDVAWKIGHATIGSLVRVFAPLRVYGEERVPLEGGLVMAFNHFSWLDPPAFGEPLRFDGLPKNSRGYKEATAEIEQRIHRLFDWLVELHELGRPARAVPPA